MKMARILKFSQLQRKTQSLASRGFLGDGEGFTFELKGCTTR
jgi:hypothetical protein